MQSHFLFKVYEPTDAKKLQKRQDNYTNCYLFLYQIHNLFKIPVTQFKLVLRNCFPMLCGGEPLHKLNIALLVNITR